jgi:hypothetical protein
MSNQCYQRPHNIAIRPLNVHSMLSDATQYCNKRAKCSTNIVTPHKFIAIDRNLSPQCSQMPGIIAIIKSQ